MVLVTQTSLVRWQSPRPLFRYLQRILIIIKTISHTATLLFLHLTYSFALILPHAILFLSSLLPKLILLNYRPHISVLLARARSMALVRIGVGGVALVAGRFGVDNVCKRIRHDLHEIIRHHLCRIESGWWNRWKWGGGELSRLDGGTMLLGAERTWAGCVIVTPTAICSSWPKNRWRLPLEQLLVLSKPTHFGAIEVLGPLPKVFCFR